MRELLLDPDPRLRKICKEVTTVSSQIIDLAAEMQEFVKGKALGLAAPQFGELVQLFIIETLGYSLALLNPRIVKMGKLRRVQEGCLSLPGRLFIVERPKVVKFTGMDLEGRLRTIKLHDHLAQVAVHEIEHLHGIMVDNIAVGWVQ